MVDVEVACEVASTAEPQAPAIVSPAAGPAAASSPGAPKPHGIVFIVIAKEIAVAAGSARAPAGRRWRGRARRWWAWSCCWGPVVNVCISQAEAVVVSTCRAEEALACC